MSNTNGKAAPAPYSTVDIGSRAAFHSYITDANGRKIGVAWGPVAEKVWTAALFAAAPELLEVLKAFVAQEVDYMTLNNLGDPEKQHNVKWARAVIAKVEGTLS